MTKQIQRRKGRDEKGRPLRKPQGRDTYGAIPYIERELWESPDYLDNSWEPEQEIDHAP